MKRLSSKSAVAFYKRIYAWLDSTIYSEAKAKLSIIKWLMAQLHCSFVDAEHICWAFTAIDKHTPIDLWTALRAFMYALGITFEDEPTITIK